MRHNDGFFKFIGVWWVIALIANLVFIGAAVYVIVAVLQWTGVL